MNRKLRTALVVSAVAVLTVAIAATFAGCNRRAVVTQPEGLSQIAMIDSKVGWAVTKNDEIFRTANGGVSWTDVFIFQAPGSGWTAPVMSACFLDKQTAFVATNTRTDNQPRIVIYRTTNKGVTWTSTSITTWLDWAKNDIGGLAISFPDASNGYVMITGTPGAGQMAKALYRTVDGGKTFSFVGDVTGMTDEAGTMKGIAGYPTGMTFSTPETGIVTCSYSAYTFVLMFKTTDGGLTWKLWSLPVPAAYQNLKPAQDFYADAYPPVFFGEQKKDGILMLDYVQNSAHVIGKHVMQSYQTTDGGGTWTLGPVSNDPNVKTYSFYNATTGWGVDQSGKLFTTTDGAATWTPATTSNP
ncbi:MAG: WD40/YVTN/BNR-like repeat-containing protein [Candidatus Cryosericum sp.]